MRDHAWWPVCRPCVARTFAPSTEGFALAPDRPPFERAEWRYRQVLRGRRPLATGLHQGTTWVLILAGLCIVLFSLRLFGAGDGCLCIVRTPGVPVVWNRGGPLPAAPELDVWPKLMVLNGHVIAEPPVGRPADGSPIPDLAARLRLWGELHQSLTPGKPPPRTLVLAVGRSVLASRLQQVMDTCAAEGYTDLAFMVEQGSLRHRRGTAPSLPD